MAKTALETVLYYKAMERINPNSGMLREVKWQYADMAAGGDGGLIHSRDSGQGTTCRDYNYPNHPDSFFQEVCDLMMWAR